MIEMVQDASIDTFLSEAGEILYKNEAANSLMLGLCKSFSNTQGEILLYRVLRNGKTVSAAVQTPPFNLILTFADENEITFLAVNLFDRGIELPGVVGPAQETTIFSQTWSVMTGASYKLGMVQKIYQADSVTLSTIEGQFRNALIEEERLVADWLFEFSKESLPEKDKFNNEYASEWASKAIQDKTAYFWLVDGKPVSVAHVGRPTNNGISIRAVYTPPVHRKKGYGSAVVGNLTQKMLTIGFSFCSLYTDVSNPTSNKIYQNVGYKEVADSRHFIFF